MGILDHLKGAAEKVGEGFMEAPGAVGSVAKKATRPVGWTWSKTIGELGDRDYTDMSGDPSAAQQQRDAVLGGIAERALASPDYRNSEASQQLIQQAQAYGLLNPQGNSLTGLLEASRNRGVGGTSTAEAYQQAGMGQIGRNSLSTMWWQVREELDLAKQQAEKVEAQFLDVLDRDVSILLDEQRDNGDIENWNGIAQMAIQMIENTKGSDDDKDQETRAFAMGILNEYQADLQPHVELEAPGWWDENFEFAEGPSAFNRTASGLARPVLEGLDAVAQNQLRGIRGITTGAVLDPGFWTGNYDYTDVAGGEDRRLNFAEAIYGEEAAERFEQAAGDWAPVVNLVGEIAVDPLTFVTFGQTKAIKTAEGAVNRQAARAVQQGAGREVMDHAQAIIAQIKKEGLKSLTQLDRVQFERWMLADAMDVARSQGTGLTGAARTKFDNVMKKGGDRMSRLDEQATKIAQKNIEDVARGGEAGIGLGGQTLLAYSDIPGIRRLMDDFEIGTKSRLVDSGETQTVRRPEGFTAYDDVTTTRFRPTPGETTGLVDESLDPRISRLRAKADSSTFEGEAAAFRAKADELADNLRKGEGDPQTSINWVEDTITERVARNDVRWIEETIPLLDEQMYSTIIRKNPGLASRIAEAAPFAAVRRRLVPRAGMINRVGRAQAQTFHTELRKAQGAAYAAHRDIIIRLQGELGRDALKEFGGDSKAFSDFLNRSLSSADQMVAARLRFGVDTSTGKLLNALEDARRQVWETLTPEQRALFGNQDTYLPRVLSDNGRKLLKQMDEDTLAALADVAPELANLARSIRETPDFGTARVGGMADDPFTRMRNIAPDVQDLRQVNKLVAEHLEKVGIKLDDLFEEDVLRAWGTRSESAFRARIVGDIFQGMRTLKDDDGFNLFATMDEYRSLDSKAKGRLSMEPTDVFGVPMYVNRELASEMKEVTEVLLDPVKRDGFGQAVNKVQSIWARYATLSPGFHSRNVAGNVFNAFLAGVTNPIRYVDAQRLQMTFRKARTVMGKEGLSFEQAIAKTKGQYDDMVAGAAQAGQDINEYILNHIPEARVLKDMEHHKVIDGLFGDVFADDAEEVGRFNVTLQSRKLGNAFEHNARAAVYLDQIAKGVAPDAAAAHVRKYLFDYQDLTRFETGVRRNVSRFYTWMRKNTALQLESLVKAPGRTVNAQKIVEEVVSQIFGDEDRSSMLPPQWAQAAGLKVRDGGNAIGIETPFFSAMNTVEDTLALPTAIAQEMGLDLPDGVEEAIGWYGLQDASQAALGLFSGLPKAAADALYSRATGYDPFTGAALQYDDTPGWIRFASIVNPAVSRAARLHEDITDEDGFTGLDWANWLAGVQVYEKDRIEGAASATLRVQMDQLIRDAKKGEAPWASMDDLRSEARIDTVNRFMHIMAYGNVEDPQELGRQLKGIVPKEVLELFGIDPGDRRFSSEMRPVDDDVARQRGLVEAIDALEVLMNRPLEQSEKAQILLMSTAAYDSEIEELGIEPVKDYSDGGVFAPEDAPDARDPLEMLTNEAAAIGLDVSQLSELRPLRTEVQRLQEQARMSGAMPGEVDSMVANYIIQEMSRTKLGTWFGPDVLPTHGWMGYGDRDAAQDNTRGWQDAAEFSFLYQMFTGKAPTQDMIDTAVLQVNTNVSDQEDFLVPAGILPSKRPSIRNRKNIQSDEEIQRDAFREAESLLGGIRNGPWQGKLPEADPRADQEFGGVGLPIAN